MNNIDIANGIIFQKLGITKDTFEDRLICQKKMYLLQSMGTDLGYTYSWYIRGPYSPSLTNYIYSNLEVLSSYDFNKYKLTKSAEVNVEMVEQLELAKQNDMGIAAWYELLASLLYIYNNKDSWKIDSKDDKNVLFKILIDYKPQYSEEQCEYAFLVLKENGFIE